MASLERADTAHARRLALRALWQGPPAFALERTDAFGDFAEDSRSFVVTTADAIRVYALPDANEIRRVDGSFRWGLTLAGRSLEPRGRRVEPEGPAPSETFVLRTGGRRK